MIVARLTEGAAWYTSASLGNLYGEQSLPLVATTEPGADAEGLEGFADGDSILGCAGSVPETGPWPAWSETPVLVKRKPPTTAAIASPPNRIHLNRPTMVSSQFCNEPSQYQNTLPSASLSTTVHPVGHGEAVCHRAPPPSYTIRGNSLTDADYRPRGQFSRCHCSPNARLK